MRKHRVLASLIAFSLGCASFSAIANVGPDRVICEKNDIGMLMCVHYDTTAFFTNSTTANDPGEYNFEGGTANASNNAVDLLYSHVFTSGKETIVLQSYPDKAVKADFTHGNWQLDKSTGTYVCNTPYAAQCPYLTSP